MDSRLHSQRQRGRLRVSRAFTPPPQQQYVQQLPPAASSHFHPQQHPLQHRISLVEDHFPRAASSGAGIPLEHCDYATLLAYRQRINGLFSSQPSDMVPHLARSQNAVWSQAQRPQGFRGAENRLALSEEYGRQGPFDRDYRDTRDDLRSLSELDSSRRSAALSAKLFLDDVRPGFQRGSPFEPAPAVELSRHRIDREEALSHDSLFSKGSERGAERGLRKRNREEETSMDCRERALRHRRFHDPGLAALPRTPESSRDFPIVQRVLSSGRFVDGEDRQDRAASPRERQESLHISPVKSVKKKFPCHHRRTSSDVWYGSAPALKRLDESKDKLLNSNNPMDAHMRLRKINGQRDSKGHIPSPKTSSSMKNSTQLGVDATDPKNKLDDTEIFNIHKVSGTTRVTGQATPDMGHEAGGQNPKQRLAAKSLSSIRKALRAVESTPRSKNVKTRVIRVLGSDAKVCGVSPKNREGEREGNALDLQMMKGTASCKAAVQHDTRSSQQNVRKETFCGIKVKQEQLVLADKSTSLQTPTASELPISLCQNFADCGNKNHTDNNVFQHGHEKEQNLMSSDVALAPFLEQEKGHPCWLVATENSGHLGTRKTGIASLPSGMPMHEQITKDQDSVCPLLSLSVNIGAERIERGNAENHQSAVSCGSSLQDSLLSTNAMVTPLIASNTGGSGLVVEEIAAECEVRLFGKSLKAPVAKASLGTLRMSAPSVSTTPTPSLPLLQLVPDQQLGSVRHCSKALEADFDLPLDLTAHGTLKDNEAVGGISKQGEDAALVSSSLAILNSAVSTPEVVCKMQGTMSRSPDKLSEGVPNVGHGTMLEPSSFLSALASEKEADELLEKEPNGPSCTIPQPEPAAASATEQQEGTIGAHATTVLIEPVMSSGMASGQTMLKEDLPIKESLVQEDRSVSEASLEHDGRPEVFSTEKPTNYIPSKQVSSLHPQGRPHKLPGRAGANTWRRSVDNHVLSSSQVLSKPLPDKSLPKVVSQKVSEVAAYVRKGNSLVRASISSITGVSPSSNPGLVGVGKNLAGKGLANLSRATRGYPGFKNVVRNTTRSSFKQVFSVQKVAPQEATPKVVSCDKVSVAVEDSESLNTGAKSMMVVTPERQHSSSLSARTAGAEEFRPLVAVPEASSCELIASVQPRPQLPSGHSVTVGSKMPDSSTTLYVKSKANQLIAALPIKTPQVASCHANPNTQEIYYKKNNNQLVRNGSEAKGKTVEYQTSGSKTQAACQLSLKKVFRKRAYLSSSRVWTLKDGSSPQARSVLPLLFPWKRPGFGLAVCAGRYKALPKAKRGSLLFLISKKLQRLRKVQPVYSRSAGGFSLHRSGVLSLSGSNLKWTKSIERRSKQASEEATKAVAEVEKQQRKEKAKAASGVAESKVRRRLTREVSHRRGRIVTIGLARYKMDPLGRTLQRLPDQWCGNAEVKQSTNSAILSTPRRLSYDGTEYVRIGNGHKLVRDPKAATRALASEKVRWSLHTARSRRAKRQQYCLFFTRFGKCNKSDGDCTYIHDPEKVAICTKFLKGTCSGMNCLFSHKVIPERMPDCSFFLEGMCTNEKCPYRHVNVNPKAPICEGFLKGFCSEGDECNKKHTTVCPTFLATGECLDKSTCKLHHPKRKCKRAPTNNLWKSKSKKRRRYFGTESIESGQCADEVSFDGVSSSMDAGAEFIEVPDVIFDFEENEELRRKFPFIKEHMHIPQDLFQGEADTLIKPILLLQRPVPV
ncbi:hypothetical protein GOP47_0019405 [Adiantum capillus-veneris]|uniref:C3H1-type domain-containing protein n=1 Tax=Adiantum capillus-veneris TaxID=13818 RepID=A0A9D4UBG9_ADICA|nr:hypothetical protein GOP47_0019405 [Adiantum capillus-veneris]